MFKKRRDKLRLYKKIVMEILETLATICLYLEYEGRKSHNKYTSHMRCHFNTLKVYSEMMRKGEYDEDEESRSQRLSLDWRL